jgi:hypothetical protein
LSLSSTWGYFPLSLFLFLTLSLYLYLFFRSLADEIVSLFLFLSLLLYLCLSLTNTLSLIVPTAQTDSFQPVNKVLHTFFVCCSSKKFSSSTNHFLTFSTKSLRFHQRIINEHNLKIHLHDRRVVGQENAGDGDCDGGFACRWLLGRRAHKGEAILNVVALPKEPGQAETLLVMLAFLQRIIANVNAAVDAVNNE